MMVQAAAKPRTHNPQIIITADSSGNGSNLEGPINNKEVHVNMNPIIIVDLGIRHFKNGKIANPVMI